MPLADPQNTARPGVAGKSAWSLGWRRFAGLLILLLAVVVAWGFRLGGPNGLTRTSFSSTASVPGAQTDSDGRLILYQLECWPWAYLDSASFGFTDLKICDTVELSGRVWQGEAGAGRWRLEHAGGVDVFVDDQRVLHRPDLVPIEDGLQTDSFDVDWSRPYLDLRVIVSVTTERANAFSGYRVVLEEQTGGGAWRRLPPQRLYTATPDPPPTESRAPPDHRRTRAYRLAGAAMALLLLLLALDRLLAAARRRPMLFALSAATFAGAAWIRIAVLIERANAEPSLWALARQTDNYLMFARAELAGSESSLLFSPGATWVLVALTELLGPDLAPAFGALAILGALGIGALTWGTGRLFGLGAAVFAGLFGTLYAPLVLYQTTLQAVTPLTTLLAWVPLALAASAAGPKRRSALGAGCLVGAATLVRPTALVLVPVFLAVIVLGKPVGELVRSRFARTASFLAGALLIMLPQFGLNQARSYPVFISANGPMNLLLGINRDSDGTYGVTDAFRESTGWRLRNKKTELEQIQREFLFDPGRVLALQARKLGLLAIQSEASNAVSYRRQGLKVSRLVRGLSANGRIGMPILVWWGLAGMLMALGLRPRRPYDPEASPATVLAGRALVMGIGLYAMATATFIVEGRIRAPLIPLLVPFAGLSVWTVIRSFGDWRRWVVSVVAAGAMVLGLLWCARELPRKAYLDEIPADATAVDLPLEGGLRLVGWKIGSSCQVPGGYAYVHFYWRYDGERKEPVNQAAWISVVTPESQKAFQPRNRKIGHRTYPIELPAEWPVGGILDEGYFLSIPRGAPAAMEVQVGGVGPRGKKPIDPRTALTLEIEQPPL